MTLRVLIADDEPLAREKICGWLADEPEVEIVGQCGDGAEAVELILKESPDLVFLDIQMPELTGIEVLETLEPDEIPVVVFVTAYDQYAIRAFELHALDYLLKPFDRERFQAALTRVFRHFAAGADSSLHKKILALIQEQQSSKRPERMAIKSAGKILFINVAEIDWIEAAGNYAKLHIGGEDHLRRETMSSLEEKLDPGKFLRIHRSTIVNCDRIQEIQPFFGGEHVVILKDGTRLTLSRRHRDRLQALLDQTL